MWTLKIAFVFTALQYVLSLTQQELNYVAQKLDVRVKLTDSLKYDGKRHTMVITLLNKGQRPMELREVDMFFHSFFMVEPDHLPKPAGYISRRNHVHLHHINGMLFKMTFLPSLGIILPNESKEIRITIQDWAVSRTDVINNWYIVSKGLTPTVLDATALDDLSFVEEFIDPNQYKRYMDDKYNPFTPIDRFNRMKAYDLGSSAVEYGIIPTPKEVGFDTSRPVTIDNSWIITAAPSLLNEANFLGAKLRLPHIDTPVATRAIILEIGNTGIDDPESYLIKSLDCADVISVKGQSPAGVFYGVQSLLSLLTVNGTETFRTLPGFSILDEPRYGYRGIHLDVARNFQPKETVIDLLDSMAQYKLNKLHLHLSDDEAWRLDIPSLPELTSVGAKRCHDLDEKTCIIPQLASGPRPVAPGSGFYRQNDYQDILMHAKSRHVEIIPEFQMPSHAHAAIKAMEERFRNSNDIDHLLTDLEDTSEYLSVQMFNDDAMNPCVESTYNFMRTVIQTIKRYHIDIMPLQYFNLGGETIPHGALVNSTACKKAFPSVTPEELPVYAKAYFMSRLAKMVIVDENLKLAGYEDAFFLNGDPLPGGSTNLLAYPYQNVWEWGLANKAYKLANSGYPVVLSPVTHLSFDHPYEPDSEERGLYWASRFTDTYKVFSLRPDDLYDNIDVKRSGEPLTRLDVCGIGDVNCDPLLRPENIMGIQAFGWTELIKDKDTLDFMLFPRVLALAERAWHRAPWEANSTVPVSDWEKFTNKVGYKELPRLDKDAIKYRLPLPGIAVGTSNNREYQVTMKAEFPNLRLQYSFDNGQSWTEYAYLFVLDDINQTIVMRTMSTDGQRSSRTARFAINDIINSKI
ncbi:HEX-like protein [Mya arenaria]|uniref:beta-N-acetylhexosaminidase n=1 Tax=Mya arenaria TaxID=6604 RepID=A0ABY7DQ27_MYAAR|nr:beta-hexosaminidase-like [Mya arenaria]WAQ99011.1 HEX-like protein [Mya arenaria]